MFVHKLYEESSYLLQWKRNPRRYRLLQQHVSFRVWSVVFVCRYMKWLSLSVDSTDVEEVVVEIWVTCMHSVYVFLCRLVKK